VENIKFGRHRPNKPPVLFRSQAAGAAALNREQRNKE